MRIEIEKFNRVLVTETFEVSDAQTFAEACRELWMRLEQKALTHTANVGELMEAAGQSVAEELNGAQIRFRRA